MIKNQKVFIATTSPLAASHTREHNKLKTTTFHTVELLLISALTEMTGVLTSKKIILTAVDYTFLQKRLWNF